MSRRSTIEDLRVELDKIHIASRRIERIILQLEEEEEQRRQQQQQQQKQRKTPKNKDQLPGLRPKDRDGEEICVGDRVLFLTTGIYSSTEGVVVRLSKNLTNVFALDNDGVATFHATKA